MRISIIRKAHFNAAHRLYIPSWSEVENKRIFGICSNPNFHGHNYELDVKVTGELDPETGVLMDLKVLKEIIEIHVEQRYDHKNLNMDCPEFTDRVPTAENICIEIHKILKSVLPSDLDIHIRLSETPRNFVEYPA
jgi:6-pyruvoyltetrahydropterin/6-carboxytetrahydropterin synthase